ncbi:hypothetical protein BDFB_004165 [Asbolus verrucosus]|uniref:Beta-mannosidase Ig-fold domain-containing protein n=1 Tax=Asbolus verrucosus TaxID=1661398 RepID=A0A482W915_ASBVE|nr:hypothetical protein BDFB_004165 [Asbolus verrucosus]
MLQYAAQDFFNPMIVTGRLSEKDQLEVYAILDELEVPQNITIKVLIHIYKWESLEPLLSLEYPITLAVLVATMDVPSAFNTVDCGSDYAVAKTKCFFHLHLMDQNNNHLVPFNYVFPEKLKNSNIANPNLKIDSVTAIGGDGKSFEIILTTDVIALFVWLDSHDITGRFSENGFLQVLPSKNITFTADEPVSLELLTETLTVTHLRDPTYL